MYEFSHELVKQMSNHIQCDFVVFCRFKSYKQVAKKVVENFYNCGNTEMKKN